jgi:hypothetical protein
MSGASDTGGDLRYDYQIPVTGINPLALDAGMGGDEVLP